MKVFLDTNVLIDVLAKRQPFYADSATVWTLAEKGQIEGQVSALSFTNIYYVIRKLEDAKTARSMLGLLRDVFTPVSCDAQILNLALASDFKDFEDAVQYFSAVQAESDCLISRNPNDFAKPRECPVLTPAEFLAAHSF